MGKGDTGQGGQGDRYLNYGPVFGFGETVGGAFPMISVDSRRLPLLPVGSCGLRVPYELRGCGDRYHSYVVFLGPGVVSGLRAREHN